MLRRFITTSVAAAVTLPVVIAGPVITTQGPVSSPHPVDAHVRELDLVNGTSGALLHVGTFSMVGVTWIADPAPLQSPVTVTARVHRHGHWTQWSALPMGDALPDADHLAGRRVGTEPWWTDQADGVNVVAGRADGTLPKGLQVSLIDPGSQASDGASEPKPAGVADAATNLPRVVSRKTWGAQEKRTWWRPEYADSIAGVVIHHTASSSNYTRAQAAQQVRAIFAYHTRSLDWGDIGYHYIVDRFGTIYEGRKGGLGSTVVGAHTYGFNHGTIGIALLGSYDGVKPSAAQMESIARITAWVLSQAHRDPLGSATYRVDDVTNPRFRKGRTVTVRAIVGHRDLYPTTCPGRAAYALLPALRKRVDQLMGPEVVLPTVTVIGSTVNVSAKLRKVSSWNAVAVGSQGSVVSRWAGGGGRTAVPWSLQGLAPGVYTLTFTARASSGASATPVVLSATVSALGPRVALPTGLTVRAGDGTVWRIDDGPTPGSQVRRAVAPWVLTSLGDTGTRLASGVDDALLALPVGVVLAPREGALLTFGGQSYVFSSGALRPVPAGSGYSSTGQQVNVADVAGIPVGAPMPSSGAHLPGTLLRAADGALSELVLTSENELRRRRVVSPGAAATWALVDEAAAPNAEDNALPYDSYVRGLADGVVTATSIVSRGQARALPREAVQVLGLVESGSDADLGHSDGAFALPGQPISVTAAPLSARVTIAGVRKPVWTVTWTVPGLA